jgi:GntR family transcriptional regulator, N-acetylglucosamine utilization regulator
MVLDLGGGLTGPPEPARADGRPHSAGQPRGTGRRRAPRLPGTTLLYERVVAHVEQMITDRGLAHGDLLPSYTELAEQAGVSLITVRRALDELERAGRVRRHQGLGTFVARPRIITQPGRAGSLLATLGEESAATQLATKVLGLHQGQPSADLCQALRIGSADLTWQLRRLRLLDGQPAVLETAVIPVTLAPELDKLVDHLGGSLYDLLAGEYGLVDAYEEQYLEVISPSAAQSRLLKLPARAHLVRIRGLSMDDAGLPFDCFEQLYPASQFAFAISGSASRRLLPAPGHKDWEVRSPS